jgi:hypothetical protein
MRVSKSPRLSKDELTTKVLKSYCISDVVAFLTELE